MKADVNYSHSKNIGEQVGEFCGGPIRSYDNFNLELDVALDVQRTVLRNQAMGCSDIPNTAEILPGEVLCSDNIIRRETTAEANGYDTFKEQNPVKMLVGGEHSKWYDNEWSTWRNKNEWTLLGNGDLIRTMSGQSTPEELCAWLNDIPKRSFILEVETDGANKTIIAKDKEGNLLYTFSYLDGTAGTYIGGDEVRPLDTPQHMYGTYSPSHVIQCLDNGNGFHREPVELKEYADEWISKYTPTSHVERITVGGTAFFAPEEPV